MAYTVEELQRMLEWAKNNNDQEAVDALTRRLESAQKSALPDNYTPGQTSAETGALSDPMPAPQTQRVENQQAQQPIKVHLGDAGAVGRQPKAESSIQVEVDKVEKQRCPPKHDQRLEESPQFITSSCEQPRDEQVYPHGQQVEGDAGRVFDRV